MLLAGYLITLAEGKRFTKTEGSIDDLHVCAKIQNKLDEIIARRGGAMETIQYPKAIPDLENSAFIVVSGAMPFSHAQFVALGRDHARLPRLPITQKTINVKKYLDIIGACQLFDSAFIG